MPPMPAVAQSPGVPPAISQQQTEPNSATVSGSQDREPALEIAPRANAMPQSGDTAEIPSSTVKAPPAVKQADSIPYIGITTQPVERCYIGGEEYGLEILTIDEGSPAAAAGLRGCTPSATKPHTSALGHQVDLALHSFATMWDVPLGDGDLVIAINDRRVRSQAEMNQEIGKLKPGDVAYLTVIRPVSAIKHETLKILVHVGRWTGPIASAAPPSP